MMRTISVALLLLAGACERGASDGTATNNGASARDHATVPANNAAPARDQAALPANTTVSAHDKAGVPADNTDKNERDREPAALTSGDQGGSEADRTVTQRVRQGVVGSDSLSINGKNVKIITRDGVVTLRGPVKTVKEKSEIAAIAKGVDGVKSVDNQLEVATN